MKTTSFPALIQPFFTDRLCTQMEASHHTIAGYRDTFRLQIRYAGSRYGKPPTKLTIRADQSTLQGRFPWHRCLYPVHGEGAKRTQYAASSRYGKAHPGLDWRAP